MKPFLVLPAIRLSLVLAMAGLALGLQGQTLVGQLRTLENNVSYDYQTDEWRSNLRAEWVTRLDAASLREFPQLLLDFEANLKPTATTDSWAARQAAWRTEVQRTRKANVLGERLLELERYLKNEAFTSEWATSETRTTWLAETRAASQQRNQPSQQAAGGSSDGSSGPADVVALRTAIRTLESNTSYSAQVEGWSEDREAWIQELNTARNGKALARCLLVVEEKMKPEGMTPSWAQQREAWRAAVKKARKTKALAGLLLEMEVFMLWSSNFGGWRTERADWNTTLRAGVGLPEQPALPREDRTPPSEEEPGEGFGEEMPSGPATPLAGLVSQLRELENNTSFDGQLESWRTDRQTWIEGVEDASSLDDLRAGIVGYYQSLQPASIRSVGTSADSRFANAEAFRQALATASNAQAVADVLIAFERDLQGNSTNENFRTTEYEEWARQLRKYATDFDNGVETYPRTGTNTPEPNTETGDSRERTPLGRMVARLDEIESNTSYDAQVETWRDARTGWTSSLNEVTNLDQYKQAILGYYNSLKPTGFRSGAEDWVTSSFEQTLMGSLNMQAVAENLVALIENLEAAPNPSWRSDLRADWETNLRTAARDFDNGLTEYPDAPREETPNEEAWEMPQPQTPAERLIGELETLENAVSFDHQVDTWREQRSAWKTSLEGATTLGDYKQAVVGFFNSLKNETVNYSAVPQFRNNGFASQVNAAPTMLAVVELLIKLQDNMVDSPNEGFRSNAASWRERLRNTARDFDSGLQRYPSSQGSVAPNQDMEGVVEVAEPMGIAQGTATEHLRDLIRTLENQTSYSGQMPGWSDQRPAWITQIEAATTLEQFKAAVKGYLASLKRWNEASTWAYEIGQSIDMAENAKGLIGSLIRVEEEYLRPPTLSEGWLPSQRVQWRNRIRAAAERFDEENRGSARSAIPQQTAPSVQPSGSPTAASEMNATVTLAAALRDLESDIRFSAQTDTWRNTLREGWWSRTTAPRSLADTRTLLLELGTNLKVSGMKLDWTQRRAAWLQETESATSYRQLGQLLVELERNLEPSSLFDGWAQKRPEWLRKLNQL